VCEYLSGISILSFYCVKLFISVKSGNWFISAVESARICRVLACSETHGSEHMNRDNQNGNETTPVCIDGGCQHDICMYVSCRATSLHWNDQKESPANSEVR